MCTRRGNFEFIPCARAVSVGAPSTKFSYKSRRSIDSPFRGLAPPPKTGTVLIAFGEPRGGSRCFPRFSIDVTWRGGWRGEEIFEANEYSLSSCEAFDISISRVRVHFRLKRSRNERARNAVFSFFISFEGGTSVNGKIERIKGCKLKLRNPASAFWFFNRKLIFGRCPKFGHLPWEFIEFHAEIRRRYLNRRDR